MPERGRAGVLCSGCPYCDLVDAATVALRRAVSTGVIRVAGMGDEPRRLANERSTSSTPGPRRTPGVRSPQLPPGQRPVASRCRHRPGRRGVRRWRPPLDRRRTLPLQPDPRTIRRNRDAHARMGTSHRANLPSLGRCATISGLLDSQRRHPASRKRDAIKATLQRAITDIEGRFARCDVPIRA